MNILIAVVVLAFIGIGLAYCSKANATGGHYVAPIVVKPPVVVPPPVVAPPPPSVAVPPPSSAAPAPGPQAPSGGGSGPGALGWYVMAGVAVYFGAVIRSHMLWCAEDDMKPAKERKCYRPLRDGMP